MNFSLFYSPLEQFEILPLISLYLGGLDFSITNETVILGLIFFLLTLLLQSSFKSNEFGGLFITPHS